MQEMVASPNLLPDVVVARDGDVAAASTGVAIPVTVTGSGSARGSGLRCPHE